MDVNIIATAEGNAHGIVYPRHINHLERFGGTKRAREQVKHPSKNEIVATIKRALRDAKFELNELGVLLDVADKECFKYDPRLNQAISSAMRHISCISALIYSKFSNKIVTPVC